MIYFVWEAKNIKNILYYENIIPEIRYTKVFIEDGLTPSPYISYTILRRDGNITYHEDKTSSGYVLRKKN